MDKNYIESHKFIQAKLKFASRIYAVRFLDIAMVWLLRAISLPSKI